MIRKLINKHLPITNTLQKIFHKNTFILVQLQTNLKESLGSCLKKVLNFTRFGLVSLFNGISTFMGYLMPKPSFKNSSSDTL